MFPSGSLSTSILFLFAGFFAFSLCALTQPFILTIGVPIFVVTGTFCGIAFGCCLNQIRLSAISLTPVLITLISLTFLIRTSILLLSRIGLTVMFPPLTIISGIIFEVLDYDSQRLGLLNL